MFAPSFTSTSVLCRSVVVVLVLVIGACANRAVGEDEAIRQLASVVDGTGTLDAATTKCIVERLVEAVGVDGLDSLRSEARKRVVSAEVRLQVIDAFIACDAIAPLLDAD